MTRLWCCSKAFLDISSCTNLWQRLTSLSVLSGLSVSIEKSSDLGTAGPAPAAEAHVAWVLRTQKTRSPNLLHSRWTTEPEPVTNTKKKWIRFSSPHSLIPLLLHDPTFSFESRVSNPSLCLSSSFSVSRPLVFSRSSLFSMWSFWFCGRRKWTDVNRSNARHEPK